jgi:serine protease
MKTSLQLSAAALLTLGLIACGGGGGTTNGSVAGTVSPGTTKPSSANFVAGEVIVKFRSALQATSAVQLQAAGLQLTRVRQLGVARANLFRAAANHQKTLEMVQQLSRRPDVEYAEVNHIYQPLAVPTDPQYNLQWHYNNMNLPAAWDISTGVATTVVAIVDDGMLYNAASANAATNDADPKTHPDFAGKVIGGYDFISDPATAEDGDARDANAYDNRIGLHGTHVAGTVAAATNNGQFGAGVDWNAKLVNVRVLGKGGGTGADITEGVLWAGGEAVGGVPANPNPAKVINMSLGGDNPCSQFEQDAYNTLTGKGVIIVVAAGNENENVNKPKSPANCNNVITVGATGPTNKRAPYSNFGARVDVMAPGGDTELSVSVGGADQEAGVYSTYFNKATNAFNLGGIQGTSMASPHVAGLVSLMVGINPALTYTQALNFLKTNAAALPAADCSNNNATVTGTDCGAGLVDAAKTLKAVKDALGGTPVAPPPAPPAPPPVKTTKNYVRAVNTGDASKSKQVEITLTNAAANYSITDLEPGSYKVVAYNDLNGNAALDANEPQVSVDVTIGSGENKTGINLTMQPDS